MTRIYFDVIDVIDVRYPKGRKLFFKALCAKLTLLCCLMLFSGCLLEGGSDTETGREDSGTLQGRVVDREGNPVSGVELRLLPSDFDPFLQQASPVTTSTDDSGIYVFENLDTAFTYNILGKREADTTFAFRANRRPGGGADTLRLDRPLRLELTLTYVDYVYNERDSTTGYFPGTDILFSCDSFTTVDSLPVGVVNLVLENLKNERGNLAIPNNNGDWGRLPMGRGGDTLRVEARKYLGQPYMLTLMP